MSIKERTTIIRDTLAAFPETPTLTLARKLYNEHPAMFTTLEAARGALRYHRGNTGDASRKKLMDKTYMRENGKAGFTTPLPSSVAKPRKAYQIPAGRTLILSDIHIPYHDPAALELALQHGDEFAPDMIYLNGDTVDFYAVSRWEKNPEERDLQREIIAGREFLAHLRERFPYSRIAYKIGNHEDRWERYLINKAPELFGVTDFELRRLLDFDRFGVELVESKQKAKAGKYLTVIHGHEIFGAFAPVNFARTLQMSLGVCTIAGHRHQTSEHSYKSADNDFVHCWSTGCLCDMSPDYAVFNKWNSGFCTLELKGNDFRVCNHRILDGKIY